jgi:Leucine-rich repeat (LRR) protein
LGSLDLSYNQLRELPDSVGGLGRLRALKLHHNPLIIPPKKVVEHSTEAVLEYMREHWRSSAVNSRSRSRQSQISHQSQSQISPQSQSQISSSYNWLASFANNGSSCKSVVSLQPSIVRVNRRRPRGSVRLSGSKSPP